MLEQTNVFIHTFVRNTACSPSLGYGEGKQLCNSNLVENVQKLIIEGSFNNKKKRTKRAFTK